MKEFSLTLSFQLWLVSKSHKGTYVCYLVNYNGDCSKIDARAVAHKDKFVHVNQWGLQMHKFFTMPGHGWFYRGSLVKNHDVTVYNQSDQQVHSLDEVYNLWLLGCPPCVVHSQKVYDRFWKDNFIISVHFWILIDTILTLCFFIDVLKKEYFSNYKSITQR